MKHTPRAPGRPRNPVIGEPVTVDTFPGARWRVIELTEHDEPGRFRLLRLDRSPGRGMQLAGILGSRLRVCY